MLIEYINLFFLGYIELFFTPTPLKTPDFKGFYSSRFAIDSNMTAKKSRCSAFYGRASFSFRYRFDYSIGGEMKRLRGTILDTSLPTYVDLFIKTSDE